jgi:uncharacterized membrane protein
MNLSQSREKSVLSVLPSANLRAIASAVTLAAIAGSASAQVASLRLLPARTIDRGAEVSVLYTALSSDGNVLGGVYRTVAGAAGERAIVRVGTADLAVRSLVDVATTQGTLTGLSHDGTTAIGNARFLNLPGQPTGGFVQGLLPTASPLPSVTGGALYTANAVSASGSFIAGTAPVGSQGLDRAIYWPQGAVAYGPPVTLPAPQLSSVRGRCVIEGLGGVPVVAGNLDDFNTFLTQPFVWTPGQTSLQTLPLPSGESSGRAADLNTAGDVLVGPLGDGVERFGRWLRSGNTWSVTDLGRFTGSTTAEPTAVSADGSRIVGSAIIGGSAQAVIWDQGFGHRRLDALLTSAGLTLPPGITLLRLDGISDDGLIMYGLAQRTTSEVQTFVVVLPRAAGCGSADLGGEGGAAGSDGLLDNNDFVVFIDRFFARDLRADFGSEGGASGPDGQFDNNDFVVFIGAFFGGC